MLKFQEYLSKNQVNFLTLITIKHVVLDFTKLFKKYQFKKLMGEEVLDSEEEEETSNEFIKSTLIL